MAEMIIFCCTSFYFAIFLQKFDVDKKVDFTREDYDTKEVKEMKTKGNLM